MGDMTTVQAIGFSVFLIMTVAFFAWIVWLHFMK